MRFLFLTNQASYHQMHFARAMVAELGEANFRIVFQKSTSADRAEMGWKDDYTESYILRFWEDPDTVLEWIDQAEVVIQGRFPIKYLRSRIRSGKLTFACQERLWKKPPTLGRKLSRLGHFWKNYVSVNKPNYHFLSIGAFAARDLNELGFFKNRSWRFGYFIDCPDYQPREQRSEIQLLWCARLIPVKQPMLALDLLAALLDEGVNAKLTLIGDGPLREQIELGIAERGLQSKVKLTGWQSQDQVSAHMQSSDLFLMTSHQGEGWGLVVNEALSFGCGVIASDQLGSSAWMVEDGKSGFIYQGNSFGDIPEKIAAMDPKQIAELGRAGHQAMQQIWSATQAAKRMIALSKLLHVAYNEQKEDSLLRARELYSDGPCSFIGT